MIASHSTRSMVRRFLFGLSNAGRDELGGASDCNHQQK
jgi:hypothetical protein